MFQLRDQSFSAAVRMLADSSAEADLTSGGMTSSSSVGVFIFVIRKVLLSVVSLVQLAQNLAIACERAERHGEEAGGREGEGEELHVRRWIWRPNRRGVNSCQDSFREATHQH